MPEGERNLRQRVQEQTVRTARDFYGDSLGLLKDMLRGDRAQLEDLAGQIPEGDAETRIREMADTYSKIEESLRQAARDVGAEDTVSEPARQAQGEEDVAGEPEWAARGDRNAIGDVAGQATGAVGQAADQVGQVAEVAQDAVGQVLGLIGQVTENLPGGQLLCRTTDEAGQTVQRAVDESGAIVEITLDEAGDIVSQKPVGNLAEAPAEEEYQNEEGQTVRIVKEEESGTLIELRLAEDGDILDLQVPPSSKV